LKLWRDGNQDGVTDEGELITLEEAGIIGLNLGNTVKNQAAGNGNTLAREGSFIWADGSTGAMGEFNLANDTFHRQFAQAVELTPEAAALPNMGGAGAVRDLREAASLNAALVSAIQDLDNLSRNEMLARMDGLLNQWAATADFQTSREQALKQGVQLLFTPQGASAAEMQAVQAVAAGVEKQLALIQAGIGEERFDAVWAEVQRIGQMLDTLETFNGQTFYTFNGSTMSSGSTGSINLATAGSGMLNGVLVMGDFPVAVSINANQFALLQQSYDALKQSVYDGLVMQTRLKGYVDSIELVIDENGLHFDFSGVDAALATLAQTDPGRAVIDCLDLMRSGGVLADVGWKGNDQLASLLGALDGGELEGGRFFPALGNVRRPDVALAENDEKWHYAA